MRRWAREKECLSDGACMLAMRVSVCEGGIEAVDVV